MLDDLLGRSALKEEIETLESELESVRSQLEAEKRRRADAVTERQESQRRANRQADRIAELEGRVERLDDGETAVEFRHEVTVRGERLDEVLSRLSSFETGPEGALTAFVADGHELPEEVTAAFGDRAALVSRAAPCVAVSDDAGLVNACLRPVVPPDPFVSWSGGFELDRGWFRPQGEYTLALVRSDLFAMGTYRGEQRLGFHGFDSALKSQHSKGGFSQARFERLRDEQIDDHVRRCLVALEKREADPLYVVGERSVLGEFADVAELTKAVDATGEPETALREAWESFWTVPLRIV